MPTVEERLALYRDVLETAEVPTAASTDTSVPMMATTVVDARPRRRLALVAAAVVAVGGLVATGLALRSDRTDRTTGATLSMPPVGVWRPAAAPPFAVSVHARAVTTDDGRVLVLGGSPGADADATSFGGGIYDPAADEWQEIPSAPLTGDATFQLAGNSVMAISERTSDQPGGAALLDLDTLTWTAIDLPSAVRYNPSPWAWSGDVLAVVHTGLSGNPLAPEGPPAVWRWQRASGTWVKGAIAEWSARFVPSVATSSTTIALWGGFTDDAADRAVTPVDTDQAPMVRLDPQPQYLTNVFTDGAIYDLAADTWTPIPDDASMSALAARRSQIALTDGGILAVAGSDESQRTTAAWTKAAGWQTLASPTAAAYIAGNGDDLVIVQSVYGQGPQAVQYLDPVTGSWTDAPGRTLLRMGTSLVALSATIDNPFDGPLQAWLSWEGGWRPVVDAPFTNRMSPAVAVVGSLVIVAGGEEGSEVEHQNDTWVLDLSAVTAAP
ncbi:MAG: hypothetical protein Q7V57_13520 [Actinomycetota bacterium]|nr:hypothetical protein [Actinomycetota bacterium]